MGQWWVWHARRPINFRLARMSGRVHGSGPLLVAIGDSHTDPSAAFTRPGQVWLRIVARAGYRTLNLGKSGDSTAQMRARIGQALVEGRPEIAVIFGGGNDALRNVDPTETERNVAFMIEWLRDHGVGRIALIGAVQLNWRETPPWQPAVDCVNTVLAGLAARNSVVFVDLAGYLAERIARGEDPDFSAVPYRQSRSWHVYGGDPHLNAYGQRLIAEAFLASTADWRTA